MRTPVDGVISGRANHYTTAPLVLMNSIFHRTLPWLRSVELRGWLMQSINITAKLSDNNSHYNNNKQGLQYFLTQPNAHNPNKINGNFYHIKSHALIKAIIKQILNLCLGKSECMCVCVRECVWVCASMVRAHVCIHHKVLQATQIQVKVKYKCNSMKVFAYQKYWFSYTSESTL